MSDSLSFEKPSVISLCRSTEITAYRQFVMPAEAGIRAALLDSGQKLAGMTL
jgi:hypothetical protein